MSALVEDLIAARDRLKPLMRQGEDYIWRPVKAAVEVMADAANALTEMEAPSVSPSEASACTLPPDDQQSQATERLRAALSAMLDAFASPLARRAMGGHDLRQQEATLSARSALSVTEPSAEGGVS